MKKFPLPVPLSIRGLAKKTGRKFWTQAEIIQIIQLQSYLHRQTMNIRPDEFIDLWNDCGGACSVTKYKFGITHDFDVGIDRIDQTKPFIRNNCRLVCLPLAYSKTRALTYVWNEEPFTDRNREKYPITTSLVDIFLTEIKKEPSYGIDAISNYRIYHNPRHSYASTQSSQIGVCFYCMLFPITRWYKKQERRGNAVNYFDIQITDETVKFSGTMTTDVAYKDPSKCVSFSHSYSLHDKSVDLLNEMLLSYRTSFVASVAKAAWNILEQWEY